MRSAEFAFWPTTLLATECLLFSMASLVCFAHSPTTLVTNRQEYPGKQLAAVEQQSFGVVQERYKLATLDLASGPDCLHE